jgi:hypothetical protein
VKLDVDTLPTVPDAPPAAGPDRALDPLPAAVVEVLPPAVVEGAVAAGEDVPHAASPITPPINAAAMIHWPLLFDNDRRTVGRTGSLAMLTEAVESGEDSREGGGAVPLPLGLPSTGGPGAALETPLRAAGEPSTPTRIFGP